MLEISTLKNDKRLGRGAISTKPIFAILRHCYEFRSKTILNKFQTLYSPQKISIIYMYMLAGALDAIEKIT